MHLVGSASVPTVLELARRHPDSGVPTDEAALREFYTFTDFAHFIEVYIAVNSLVRTADDVEALAGGVLADLAGQQVRYVELTVTPDSHLLMGIEPDGVAEALTRARARARAELGLEVELDLRHPRRARAGVGGADHRLGGTVRARRAASASASGGPEIGVPRPQFADVFARARALGLASLPHAGETTGPETVWDALRVLGAQRIGHGIAAAQDPALLAHLAEHRIPLEVCPTSNVCTRAVASLERAPVAAAASTRASR